MPMYFWGYASYYLAHLDNTSNIAFLPLKYIARIICIKRCEASVSCDNESKSSTVDRCGNRTSGPSGQASSC